MCFYNILVCPSTCPLQPAPEVLVNWFESVSLKTAYVRIKCQWSSFDFNSDETFVRCVVDYYYANEAQLNIFACVFPADVSTSRERPSPHKRVRSPWADARLGMSTAVQQCPTYSLHAGETVTHTCMHMKPFYKTRAIIVPHLHVSNMFVHSSLNGRFLGPVPFSGYSFCPLMIFKKNNNYIYIIAYSVKLWRHNTFENLFNNWHSAISSLFYRICTIFQTFVLKIIYQMRRMHRNRNACACSASTKWENEHV